MTPGSLERTVSVVVPCYNVEQFVTRGLDSVLAQIDAVKELIIVDDGSSDDTVARVKSWMGARRSNATLIEQPNSGACAARNVGLSRASGEFIQFLDADDELLPGKLASQVECARAAGNADLVVGSGERLGPDGGTLGIIQQEPGDRDPWLDLMMHRLSVTSCILWRREALVAAGAWDGSMRSSQEYELMFRMLQRGARIAYDPKTLTRIHERPGASISHTNITANRTRYVELRTRMLRHIEGLQDGRDMRPYLQSLYDNLRVLYNHDPSAAITLHDAHIPKRFKPDRSPATGTSAWLLHRLLGFERAEKIRAVLRG